MNAFLLQYLRMPALTAASASKLAPAAGKMADAVAALEARCAPVLPRQQCR